MSKQVLPDENLPQRLRFLLTAHRVVTAAYQGWAGESNGELIAAAEEVGFDVLVTADQGLNYRQNMRGRTLALVVLSTNRNSLVVANVEKISAAITAAAPGSFTAVDIGN